MPLDAIRRRLRGGEQRPLRRTRATRVMGTRRTRAQEPRRSISTPAASAGELSVQPCQPLSRQVVHLRRRTRRARTPNPPPPRPRSKGRRGRKRRLLCPERVTGIEPALSAWEPYSGPWLWLLTWRRLAAEPPLIAWLGPSVWPVHGPVFPLASSCVGSPWTWPAARSSGANRSGRSRYNVDDGSHVARGDPRGALGGG
jgi:hypothetical protein